MLESECQLACRNCVPVAVKRLQALFSCSSGETGRLDRSSGADLLLCGRPGSGGEGVFTGDPPARSEATEGGVEHPLPRSEQGGRLAEGGGSYAASPSLFATGHRAMSSGAKS